MTPVCTGDGGHGRVPEGSQRLTARGDPGTCPPSPRTCRGLQSPDCDQRLLHSWMLGCGPLSFSSMSVLRGDMPGAGTFTVTFRQLESSLVVP